MTVTTIRTRRILLASLAATGVLVAGGCGAAKAGSATATAPTPAASASQSPSPSASQGALAGLVSLAGYIGQVRPVATRIEATVTSLPHAVNGLSKRPDKTWTASAARLRTLSARLGSEASDLAAISPPQSLASVQRTAVQGLRAAQMSVDKTAAALSTGATSNGTSSALIKSQVAALRAQLGQLGQRLVAAVEQAVGSSGTLGS
jgi:hypothetical protein